MPDPSNPLQGQLWRIGDGDNRSVFRVLDPIWIEATRPGGMVEYLDALPPGVVFVTLSPSTLPSRPRRASHRAGRRRREPRDAPGR